MYFLSEKFVLSFDIKNEILSFKYNVDVTDSCSEKLEHCKETPSCYCSIVAILYLVLSLRCSEFGLLSCI